MSKPDGLHATVNYVNYVRGCPHDTGSRLLLRSKERVTLF